MPPAKPSTVTKSDLALRLFALAFGGFLGLALLKFPNPPVVEHLIGMPTNGWEWVFTSWPVRCAYPFIGLLALAAVALVQWPAKGPKLLVWLPLAWLLWVAVSASQTMDAGLSRVALLHLGSGVVCFYLGMLVVARVGRPGWLLAGVVCAFAVVLAVGWEQHFGGLEAARQHYLIYEKPKLAQPPPPELLKRMEGGRIFSTLFYANSLAGALLLLTPCVLGLIVEARSLFTSSARWFLGAAVAVGAASCLVWSGSKAGWLLALLMAAAVLLKLPIQRRIKVVVISIFLAAGMLGFLVKYLGFFQRGATSVVARFDYWRAAAQNVAAHPVFGSGPGTFGTVYKQLKSPDAEMSRLVHNDYLQQASDSGFLAGGLFLAFVGLVMVSTRQVWRGADWLTFGVWLGLAGFALQAMVEFGFYVPATAWCWFGLAGWLVGRDGLRIDNRTRAA